MSLTTEQRAALRRAAKIELARRNLLDFVQITHPGYEAGWFHKKLAGALERFVADSIAGKSPRLIVACQPRLGKTELSTKRLPVWAMGKYPGLDFICASYSSDLAQENSQDARDMIEETVLEIFPGLAPYTEKDDGSKKKHTNTRKLWITSNKSRYKAVGVDGPATGSGCTCLIIDDPFKDWEDANSPTKRRKVHNWYDSTATTRLTPGGGILIVATRWHDEDLTGFLLDREKKGGDKWERLIFPAIAEEDEEFRKIGEVVHPERWPLKFLLQKKKNTPAQIWASLYQQRPSPAGGGIIKREWFKRYSFDPMGATMDSWLISVDATFKGKSTSDFVVFQCWGKRGTDMFLLDQFRARMGYVQTRAALRDFRNKWIKARTVLVEDKANGSALLDELKSEISGLVPYSPSVSKEERLHVASVYCEAGQVHLPANAPWVGDFVHEVVIVPNGKHDDQADTFSMAIIRMTQPKKKDAKRGVRAFSFMG